MTLQCLIENLKRSLEANDTEAVRNILSANPELLNPDEPASSDVKSSLLSKATNRDNKAIIDLVVNYPEFLKHAHKVDLDKYLIRAIFKGNVQLAEFLLINGAKVENTSAIRYVFYRTNISSRKEMLMVLLKHGLDHTLINEHGKNILHQFINSFVEKKDQDAADVAYILLNCGVSINEPDFNGYSPLHHAVLKQNIKLVSFFLKKGANVNSRCDTSGISPLHLAVQCHSNVIVDMLLSHGAEINAQTSSGWTAMHKACLHYNEKMISYFIRKGADISVESHDGETPFSLLDPDVDEYDKCVRILIKEFAKMTFENIPVSQIDARLILTKPNAWEHYQKCLSELDRMMKTDFHSPHTFYSMMNMSIDIDRLAKFTKNEELVSKFEFYVRGFDYYNKELQMIWDEATEIRDISLNIESRLYYIFGDCFPDIVIKKLAENLSLEDLPVS